MDKRVEDIRDAAQTGAERALYRKRLNKAAQLAGISSAEALDAFAQGVRFGRMAAFIDAGHLMGEVLKGAVQSTAQLIGSPLGDK